MAKIKSTIRSVLKSFDIGLIRHSSLENLRRHETAANDLDLLLSLPTEFASQLLQHLRKSKSQLRQDLFVLSQLGFRRNGFFVEFGATNGVDLSNTYLLEKEFGWSGILAEPARCWHNDLRKNRTAAIIESKCIWKNSGSTLKFNEVEVAELSTINSFSEADVHRSDRRNGRTYDVKTISLNELLEIHRAPHTVDYLSIDTEGSEFEILNSFDFSRHIFRTITCEHNFTPMRERILELLSRNGYERVYQSLSKFDDWYVHSH